MKAQDKLLFLASGI